MLEVCETKVAEEPLDIIPYSGFCFFFSQLLAGQIGYVCERSLEVCVFLSAIEM